MKATPDSRRTRWFRAVERAELETLATLLHEGFDLEERDSAGRTALFYAVAPAGGTPATVKWLLERGAKASAVDHRGLSILAYGRLHVASGAENSTLMDCASILADADRPRFRALEEALGGWFVERGADAGLKLSISRHALGGDLRPLSLRAIQCELTPDGELNLRGEHHGNLVEVVMTRLDEARARLLWSDGVTHGWELFLKR